MTPHNSLNSEEVSLVEKPTVLHNHLSRDLCYLQFSYRTAPAIIYTCYNRGTKNCRRLIVIIFEPVEFANDYYDYDYYYYFLLLASLVIPMLINLTVLFLSSQDHLPVCVF